ncbi:short chain dehydrogenase [Dyella solisilvae]|uniref:Short chain dehydrogenase n=1 Tax=Dyella solisilvae TaxID=1920168 RepID=A0A370KD22_9GAMM|nr:short chain dehydrogenase [Dyella solisilvae]RDJ00520.1 short chain dehydrogenase [Dyella solisilvae]
MRLLLVGASGTVGQAVANELAPYHELIRAGRHSGDLRVDLTDMASVERMYEAAGPLDGVITTAGNVHFGELAQTTPAQFNLGLQDKLMGQVNVVLAGIRHLRDGGSFTLTSGITGAEPIRLGANATTVNAAIEGFVRAAATELPRGLRINVVSATLLTESQDAYGPYFPGFEAVPGARVALAYRRSVEGVGSGRVYTVWQ